MNIQGKSVICCAIIGVSLIPFIKDCKAETKAIIEPKIWSAIAYDSNYWRSEENELGVITYVTKPGIVLGYETPKMEINLDTTVDFFGYDDQDTPRAGVASAEDDNYVGFTGDSRLNYELTDRINVGVLESFYITRDPARASVNNNSIARDKYTLNFVEPNAYYQIVDKFGIKGSYRNSIIDYEKDLEDSTENRGIFDFYYDFNKISTVYVDYQFWKRSYDQDSSDYTSNMVTLNYEHKFNYFSITAGGGYHKRTFDSSELDDLDLFAWKIDVEGIDPESTMQTTRSFMNVSIGQEMNDDGAGDAYYTASYGRFEGGYRVFDRVMASLKLGYQNSDYKTTDRNDDTYLLSGKIAYQTLDFLVIGVEGGTETRDSDVDGMGYDSYFVALTVDINYDFGSRK